MPRLLICMMGLPRSGKSTVARKLSRAWGAPIVNRDSIRLAVHGERYLKPAEPFVRVLGMLMVEALFNAGHQIVIVDETNLKRSTRDYWQGGEWDTKFLPVETPPAECLRRAAVENDAAIRPVIVKMRDYTEMLAADEEEYDVQNPGVFATLEASRSKGLEIDVTG
jgi:predicted kinase